MLEIHNPSLSDDGTTRPEASGADFVNPPLEQPSAATQQVPADQGIVNPPLDAGADSASETGANPALDDAVGRGLGEAGPDGDRPEPELEPLDPPKLTTKTASAPAKKPAAKRAPSKRTTAKKQTPRRSTRKTS